MKLLCSSNIHTAKHEFVFSLNNLIILFLYSYCQEQREATTIILQYTTNGIGKLSDQRYLLAFH